MRTVHLLLLVATTLVAPAAEAQQRVGTLGPSAAAPRAADLVAWQLEAAPARRGQTARLILTARIAEGWKLYALDSEAGVPLRIELGALPSGLRAEAPRQGTPDRGLDPVLRVPFAYFAGTARFEQPLRVGRFAPRGTHRVQGHVRFTVCDDRVCLAPARVPFSAAVTVR
ncbi:MAG: protein-disulfide reductase DsbD domain-containing protein [Rubricoccaceae bacterium]